MRSSAGRGAFGFILSITERHFGKGELDLYFKKLHMGVVMKLD